jgi:hypothetical protein
MPFIADLSVKLPRRSCSRTSARFCSVSSPEKPLDPLSTAVKALEQTVKGSLFCDTAGRMDFSATGSLQWPAF